MGSRLIALDMHPGVRPVGVGETWWRLIAKCILRVTEKDTKATCVTKHTDGGVESGIEGGVDAMRLIWTYHYQEEYLVSPH